MAQYHKLLHFAALVLLAACGSGVPFDDAEMFSQHFGASPVVIAAPAAAGATAGTTDALTCAFAQLFESGRMRYVPMPEREPYISLASNDQAVSGGGAILFSGRREFGSSSDEQRYTRNANEYFAQTVTYFIRDPTSPFAPSNPAGFGPFSLRAVYVNDPAVGQWRLESFTPVAGGESFGSDQGATQTILSEIAQRGCPTQAMAASAATARTEAMNQIEAQLASAGTLARGPVANTIVSRRNQKIWHTGRFDTTDRAWRDMFTICRGINIGAGRNWRPPTLEDLRTIMRPVASRNNAGVLIDTPDGRFFGSVINARGQIRLAVSNLYTYDGEGTTLEQADARRAVYRTYVFLRGYDQEEYRPDMNLTWTPGDYPLQGAQLLCVADYAP